MNRSVQRRLGRCKRAKRYIASGTLGSGLGRRCGRKLQWRETRFHVNRKVVLMNHRRSRFSASAAALSTALLVGCGSSDPRPTTTTTSAAIANPASVFCVSQGGKVEIVDEAGGQVGYCDLPGGTRVEEWAYFRSQTGTTSVP